MADTSCGIEGKPLVIEAQENQIIQLETLNIGAPDTQCLLNIHIRERRTRETPECGTNSGVNVVYVSKTHNIEITRTTSNNTYIFRYEGDRMIHLKLFVSYYSQHFLEQLWHTNHVAYSIRNTCIFIS